MKPVEYLNKLIKRPALLVGLLLLLVQLAAILFGPLMTPYSPVEANPLETLQPPSLQHPLGTDVSGMDIFSRIVYATRINLIISIGAVGIAFLAGVPIGLFIGYYRGPVSGLIMRIFDFIQAFPVFVLGLALVSVLGQEIWNVAIVLAVLFTPMFARLIRAEVLSLRERPFVSAARCNGAHRRRRRSGSREKPQRGDILSALFICLEWQARRAASTYRSHSYRSQSREHGSCDRRPHGYHLEAHLCSDRLGDSLQQFGPTLLKPGIHSGRSKSDSCVANRYDKDGAGVLHAFCFQ